MLVVLFSVKIWGIIKGIIYLGRNAFTGSGCFSFHSWKEENREEEELVQALLDAGAKPEMKDNTGRTAMDYAKESYNPEGTNVLHIMESFASSDLQGISP